jgi:hypothetical protein
MANEHGREIPRGEWAAFFARLSRDYQGADTTVEQLSPDDQPQLLIFGQPLADIGGEDNVTIRLGAGEHVVERASGVTAYAERSGLGQVIVIQPAGGPPVRITLAREGERAVGAVDPREGDIIADPGFVGGSAGASGGSVAAGDGHGAAGVGEDYGPRIGFAGSDGRPSPGVGDDYGSPITFGASDDMGGVASVGGGSLGDQDLSGRRSYDITDDVYGGGFEDLLDDAGESGGRAGPGSETRFSGAASFSQAQGSNSAQTDHHKPDVIDGGSGQGVIDTTADPVGGSKLDPANDASDPYVEGDVGAQVERDLDELMDDHPELRGPIDEDARKRD